MSDEPLRVLLVANTLPPRDVSGVGEQVLQLAGGLRAAGCVVEVLGRGVGGARGPKVLFPLTVVPAVWHALRRFRPDVVQVHESDGALAALLVRALRGRSDRRDRPGSRRPLLAALLQVSYREERRAVRPLVAPDGRVLGRPGAVEQRFRQFKAPLHIALGTLTARLADVVLAPSAATAAEIERDYGVAGVRVVPNVTNRLPVSPAQLADAAGEAGGAQPSKGEELARPVASGAAAAQPAPGPLRPILFVGRLRIRKGVEVLLEALAALPPVGATPELLIAGDGEHLPVLEECARHLGLGDRVRFLGRQSAAQVSDLLAGARALIVPSIYEGMPLVVLEAMAAGLPVVASRVSGIPEVVVDGETGWLVPPEDPPALARALAALASDPGEAASRGAAGRRRVEDHFRPRHAARPWIVVVIEKLD